MRDTVEPTSTEKTVGGTVETTFSHPAFGSASVVRTQGRTVLFDSALEENNTYTLTIERAVNCRSLHGDRVSPQTRLVEVEFSPSQWFELLAGGSNGRPVPCTIRWDKDGLTPLIAKPQIAADLFQAELAENLHGIQVAAEHLIAEIQQTKLSQKARDELVKSAQFLANRIASSTGFAASQFDRYAEETTSRARTSLNDTLTQLGLTGGAPRLLLGREDEGE